MVADLSSYTWYRLPQRATMLHSTLLELIPSFYTHRLRRTKFVMLIHVPLHLNQHETYRSAYQSVLISLHLFT